MAKETCNILSNNTDFTSLLSHLRAVYGNSAIEVTGSDLDWTSITITQRKLFSKTSIVIRPVVQPGFAVLLQQMQHVFRVIVPENKALHEKLMVKIATSRCLLEVEAKSGVRGFEAIIFAVAKHMDGLVFYENDKLLNADGRLVMSLEGKSQIEDLKVEVEAELLDQFLHKSPESEARKQQTIRLLQAKSVPFASSLPGIDAENHTQLRSQQEVVERALALLLVALKGEGLPVEILEQVEQQFGMRPYLSPKESAFIEDPSPAQQQKITFVWRYEAIWALLWALGWIDELHFPDKICDVGQLVGIFRETENTANFAQRSKLRSATEILDAADLIYRLNWACVDARLRSAKAPANLDAGVVYERHYALNWLRNYLNLPWDDVRTDT